MAFQCICVLLMNVSPDPCAPCGVIIDFNSDGEG